MRIDEYIPFEEMRLMDMMKGKSRMDQDQILGERQWTKNSKVE